MCNSSSKDSYREASDTGGEVRVYFFSFVVRSGTFGCGFNQRLKDVSAVDGCVSVLPLFSHYLLIWILSYCGTSAQQTQRTCLCWVCLGLRVVEPCSGGSRPLTTCGSSLSPGARLDL